jgi:PAS domain S-box-containing protein
VDGEDEVGQLRRAFEHMRSSLKARLDELNRLLVVSQGVASSLEAGEALRPVLEAALSTGACSARVVLSSDVAPETQVGGAPVTHFGAGSGTALYSHLDEQILALARQQETRIIMTNPTRVRVLNFAAGMSRPEALLALPLRHENLYFGVLWVAYDVSHQFSEDEVRFLSTLGGEAALAAANARLFANSEVGRQQLEAILASTPDPVLVTDQQNNLLLANPAAWQALGLTAASVEGKAVDQVIQQADLVRLLLTFSEDHLSAEVPLPDGRVYLATASTVVTADHPVGRICILRDITHFKELDQLKSDFVSTVTTICARRDTDARLRYHAGNGRRVERPTDQLRAQDRDRRREYDPPGDHAARPGPHRSGCGLAVGNDPRVRHRGTGGGRLADPGHTEAGSNQHRDLAAHHPADRSRPRPLAAGHAQPGGERHQIHRPRRQGFGARLVRPRPHGVRG